MFVLTLYVLFCLASYFVTFRLVQQFQMLKFYDSGFWNYATVIIALCTMGFFDIVFTVILIGILF